MTQGPSRAAPGFALPAVLLGSAAATGNVDALLRADATLAAFDATVPVAQAFGDAAAVGTAAFAARRDHRHGMPLVTVASLPVMPACRVYHSATQALTTGTDTPLVFDSEVFDTDAIHSTSTNTGRLTCQTAGVYLILARLGIEFNATGRRYLLATHNRGAAQVSLAINQLQAPTTSPAGAYLMVGTIYPLLVGDYVTFSAFQDSGVGLNVVAASAAGLSNCSAEMIRWGA